eukprot:PhM_4_TR9655/c0_g1_i1/m.53294/K03861/PIGP, GPI19, DSCR5; phosphatidylinositol glycan, class P
MVSADGVTPLTAIYGFIMWVSTFLLFNVFIAWALVPDVYLHAVGITYYPDKYWAVAAPAIFVVSFLFYWSFYLTMYLKNTLPLDDVRTIGPWPKQKVVVSDSMQVATPTRRPAGSSKQQKPRTEANRSEKKNQNASNAALPPPLSLSTTSTATTEPKKKNNSSKTAALSMEMSKSTNKKDEAADSAPMRHKITNTKIPPVVEWSCDVVNEFLYNDEVSEEENE